MGLQKTSILAQQQNHQRLSNTRFESTSNTSDEKDQAQNNSSSFPQRPRLPLTPTNPKEVDVTISTVSVQHHV
jgi:hypothetical protein